MKEVLNRFEVLIEHTEVSRVVVFADCEDVARERAFEYERRGDVVSSESVSNRCVACYKCS